jgi:hypothetical protein
MHEGLHLLPHVPALQLHGLTEVLALGFNEIASALRRVISAILALSAYRLARPDGELLSSDFHVFSLVETKVSNARLACSMLIFMSSRSPSGISGFMNASLAMLLSCCGTCPLSCGGGSDGGGFEPLLWRAAFSRPTASR